LKIDLLAFFINFIISLLIVFVLVGAIIWKFDPYASSERIFQISGAFAIIVGIVVGIGRDRFWKATAKIISIFHNSRKN